MQVSPTRSRLSLTVELAYSYVNMGDGITGDLKAFDGTNNIVNGR